MTRDPTGQLYQDGTPVLGAEKKTMLYLDDVLSGIQISQLLLRDIEPPKYLNSFLRLNKMGLTMWGDI